LGGKVELGGGVRGKYSSEGKVKLGKKVAGCGVCLLNFLFAYLIFFDDVFMDKIKDWF